MEGQLAEALGRMAEVASYPSLKNALLHHRDGVQVRRQRFIDLAEAWRERMGSHRPSHADAVIETAKMASMPNNHELRDAGPHRIGPKARTLPDRGTRDCCGSGWPLGLRDEQRCCTRALRRKTRATRCQEFLRRRSEPGRCCSSAYLTHRHVSANRTFLPRWPRHLPSYENDSESRSAGCRPCTRFLPATKAIPKEMLPVVDRPLIEHVVDEGPRGRDRALHFRDRPQQGGHRGSFRPAIRTKSRSRNAADSPISSISNATCWFPARRASPASSPARPRPRGLVRARHHR